jgi:hypothetical protein
MREDQRSRSRRRGAFLPAERGLACGTVTAAAKLGVADKTAAVVAALRHGLIE